MPYLHIVFTVPRPVAKIVYANRKVVFNIMMKTTAQTLITIAADPKRFGARIGGTTVLHTWNSALDFHPHVHAIVPNGGFDVNTGQWKSGSSTFLAPIKVLGRFFTNRLVNKLAKTYRSGDLVFPGAIAHLKHPEAFEAFLNQIRETECNVYAKTPFAGPRNLLKYLSRYTHRVPIGNSRNVSFDGKTIAFRYRKPVRNAHQTPDYGIINLSVSEFIRRFLMHTLPSRLHRVRHFGILSNSNAKKTFAKVQAQTRWRPDQRLASEPKDDASRHPKCPACKQPMRVLVIRLSPAEILEMFSDARAPPLEWAA